MIISVNGFLSSKTVQVRIYDATTPSSMVLVQAWTSTGVYEIADGNGNSSYYFSFSATAGHVYHRDWKDDSTPNWTASASSEYKSSVALAPADVSGNLPADVKAITSGVDLSATMKASINAEADTALSDAGVTTTKMNHLDADVSSRSTYAGGAVASVTAAVTVGTNQDKTGYTATVSDKTGFSLSSAGVLAIWHTLLSDITTALTIGKKFKDWVLGSDSKSLISTDTQDLSSTLKVDAKVVEDKTGYALTPAYDAAKTALQSGGSVVALNMVSEPNNMSIGLIKTITDKLGQLIENVNGNRFTTKALEEAPTGSGGVIGDVTLAASQPNYAPAKAGDPMDLVDAPNATAIIAFWNQILLNQDSSPFDSNSVAKAIKTVYTYESYLYVLLNMLVESDGGGNTRFKAKTLEEAPTSSVNLSEEDLQAIIESISGLTGPFHVVLTFLKTGTVLPLEGVHIMVMNSSDTVPKGITVTDSNGIAEFNIDSGDYILRPTMVGYLFDNISLTVDGDTEETYYGDVILIGYPTSGNACRVYENMRQLDDGTYPEEIIATAQIVKLPYNYNGSLHSGDVFDGTYDNTTGLVYWDIVRGVKVLFKIENFLRPEGVRKIISDQVSVRLTYL